MFKLKKWLITLRSVSPIIWNCYSLELQQEMSRIKNNEKDEWEKENWQRKAEYKDNFAVIPVRWIRSCLYNACKRSGVKPYFEKSAKATYTSYFQIISYEMIKDGIVAKKDALIPLALLLKAQPGSNKSTKVLRIRPLLKDWCVSFTLIDPAGRMNKEDLSVILETAGMFVGLGDSRPDNYGRFEVSEIKEVK